MMRHGEIRRLEVYAHGLRGLGVTQHLAGMRKATWLTSLTHQSPWVTSLMSIGQTVPRIVALRGDEGLMR